MKVVFFEEKDHVSVCIGKNIEACYVDRLFFEEKEEYSVFSLITESPVGVFLTMEKAIEAARSHVEEELMDLEWPKDDERQTTCTELDKLLKAEMDIIRKHLSRHKWFQMISDEQFAAMDFVKKYGWIMKELYCLNACKKRNKCDKAKSLRNGGIEETPIALDK